MREKQITLGDKTIIIREVTVGDLRKRVLPAIIKTFSSFDLNAPITDIVKEADKVLGLIPQIIPDVTTEMLENAYMSELENLVQSWIDVNFHGLKTLLGSFTNLPTPGRS